MRPFTIFCLLAVLGLAESEPAKERPPAYEEIGHRISATHWNGAAVTSGSIRVRRRHENDMDFGKYNPFYWEGRRAWFTVIDFTPTGEHRIEFHLQTEWPQDHETTRGSDLSAIYIGDPTAHETKRSTFAINARMDHVKGYTHFKKTIDEGAFRAFPDALKPGALLTFEFRFFNDKEHPGWVRQKERNPHNLSAYYSEFLRIKIGEAGLLIDHGTERNALPSPRRYTGGWTTIPTVRVEPWTALQQPAFNLRAKNAESFLLGRTWFHTDLHTGKHIGDTHDDKPSIFFADEEKRRSGHVAGAFNAVSCNACHQRNAGAFLPGNPKSDIHETVLKTPDGHQIQTRGAHAEGMVRVRFETHIETLADGTAVELRKPIFSVDGNESLPVSPRRPPSLIGMGLLDAVERHSGAGRFGWKAEKDSLAEQIDTALEIDMGSTFDRSSWPVQESAAPPPARELPPEAHGLLLAYTALLGVPPRDRPEHPDVLAGEALFTKIGCASCHTPSLRTGSSPFPELAHQTIHPYSDLDLHDMGPGLADTSGHAHASYWRTAPLWALKNTRDAASHHRDKFSPGNTEVTYLQTMATARNNPLTLLHDGRARSLAEAILWHGGEAENAANAYRDLSAEQREKLAAFVWDL